MNKFYRFDKFTKGIFYFISNKIAKNQFIYEKDFFECTLNQLIQTGKTDLVKQGQKIGDKISNQQGKWSNPTFRETIKNLNQNASFLKNPFNMLGLVDLFDVPSYEKSIIQNAIKIIV